MKKIIGSMALLVLTSLFLFSCSSITKEECMSKSSSQYEFGKEMATWSMLRGGISLDRCVREYQEQMGLESFKADDPCVKKGFEDGKENK